MFKYLQYCSLILTIFLPGSDSFNLENNSVPDNKVFTVSGKYVDKKGNPIKDASVKFIRDGAAQATGQTDANGDFSMQIAVVGIDDPEAPEYGLEQNYPNPFYEQTRIPLSVDPGIRVQDNKHERAGHKQTGA